jgi:hypothetical protein
MEIFFDIVSDEYYKIEDNQDNTYLFYIDDQYFIPEKFKFELGYSDLKINKMSLIIEIFEPDNDFLNIFSEKFNLKSDNIFKQKLQNSFINIKLIPKSLLIERFTKKLISLESFEELYEIDGEDNIFINLENYDLEDFKISLVE